MNIESWWVSGSALLAITFLLAAKRWESAWCDARSLVLYAVLSALAVVSRLAFAWLPHMKPMAAICMLSAAAFGSRAGLFIGASSVFLSNFSFGHGPWTPWQMVAFGTSAAIFGAIFFRKKAMPWMLSSVGFLLVIFCLGPILDCSVVLQIQARLTWETALPIFLAGIPINLIHAIVTGIVIQLIGEPFLRRTRRLALRYGMTDVALSETDPKEK